MIMITTMIVMTAMLTEKTITTLLLQQR